MPNTASEDWIDTALALAALREALDDVKRQLAERRVARETKYNPRWRDQPRAPRGVSDGGQWIDGGGDRTTALIPARVGVLNYFSPYARRSRRYAAIQSQLESAGFHRTFYFAAVSKMTANLANMDNPLLGSLAGLSMEVRAYSNTLSQAIADFNDSQLSRVISGLIRERGRALDTRLITDEQRFIQGRLDRLAWQNPRLYRDFIRGVNRNANMDGLIDAANGWTDQDIADAADRTRTIIGGPIDFANEQHRIVMGEQMVAVLRLRN